MNLLSMHRQIDRRRAPELAARIADLERMVVMQNDVFCATLAKFGPVTLTMDEVHKVPDGAHPVATYNAETKSVTYALPVPVIHFEQPQPAEGVSDHAEVQEERKP